MAAKITDRMAGGVAAALAICAAGFALMVRLRLLSMPLERDEGEFAYTAQLICDGLSPFLAYNYKFPGVAYVYALFFTLFGQTPEAVRLALLTANFVASVLLYLLARRLLGSLAAGAAAAAYVLLSLDPSVLGNAAHATQFVTCFALGGLLLLDLGTARGGWGWLFGSGLLLGLAMMMKQHAALLLPMAWGLAWYRRRDERQAWLRTGMPLLAGLALPCLVLLGLVLLQGVWPIFWRWTIVYAHGATGTIGPGQAWSALASAATSLNAYFWPVWCLAGVGLLSLYRPLPRAGARCFLVLFTAAALASAMPGFYFRPHYFVPFLAAIALLAGSGTDALRRMFARTPLRPVAGLLALVLLAAGLTWGVSANWSYYVSASPEFIAKQLYGENPFVESPIVAELINKRTLRSDRIAVLGSEAQLYFYSDRRAATGYIYTYGLVAGRRHNLTMQAEMQREIEAAAPRIIVFADSSSSWCFPDRTEQPFFRWAAAFLRSHYLLIGLVDILPGGPMFVWGEPALSYVPKSPSRLFIYERRY